MSALSAARATVMDLASLEAVIAEGLDAFVTTVTAFLAVRDRGLYRDAGYETFEAYCRQRWGFSHAYGKYLLAAGKVAANLAQGQPVVAAPTRERQCRPLVGLEPAEQRAVWAEASADGPPSGAAVQRVADRVRHEKIAGADLLAAAQFQRAELQARDEARRQAAEKAKRAATLERIQGLGNRLSWLIGSLGEEAAPALTPLRTCLDLLRSL